MKRTIDTMDADRSQGALSPLVAGAGTDERASRVTSVAKQRIQPMSYAKVLLGGSMEDEAHFVAAMHARLGSDTHVIPISANLNCLPCGIEYDSGRA